MTTRELNAMFIDHVRRAGDLWCDPLLQRAVIAGHARRNGRNFNYGNAERHALAHANGEI